MCKWFWLFSDALTRHPVLYDVASRVFDIMECIALTWMDVVYLFKDFEE